MSKAAQEIKEAIKSAKNILLVTHVDPDGDGAGSLIALALLLVKMQKNPTMVCPGGVPEVYKFLPHTSKVLNEIPEKKFDLAILADCGDIKRVGANNIRQHVPKIINIDHHIDNTYFGDINHVEQVSSVAEQIYTLAHQWGIKIDKDIAKCLYIGAMTDTGNFRYDRTTTKTFEMVADLLRYNINLADLSMAVYETKTFSAMRILGAALYNLKKSPDHRLVWTVLTNKMMEAVGAKSEELTGIVDQLRAIKGVEVAVLMREEKDGKVKINFRSKSEVDVQAIAQALGGGGHVKAAGAVQEGPIEEVEDKVVKTILKFIGKNNKSK